MNIFNPDSKFMFYVRIVGDMIILNVLFTLCSIPIITIGAAHTGLYTGLREIFDRDSDNSASKSFFKGFKNGFVKITGIWTAILAILSVLGYCIYFLYEGIKQKVINTNVPIIVAIIAFIILCINITQTVSFHSKFDCKPFQLIKNSAITSLAYPLRSLLAAIVMWLPVAILFADKGYTFARLSPLWFGFYFSFASYLIITLTKKPYERIIYPNGKPEEETEEIEEE